LLILVVEEGDVGGGTAVKSIITLDQIEELDFIHQRLDTAVLALNLARAGR
jgi:hypothetical protein